MVSYIHVPNLVQISLTLPVIMGCPDIQGMALLTCQSMYVQKLLTTDETVWRPTLVMNFVEILFAILNL